MVETRASTELNRHWEEGGEVGQLESRPPPDSFHSAKKEKRFVFFSHG